MGKCEQCGTKLTSRNRKKVLVNEVQTTYLPDPKYGAGVRTNDTPTKTETFLKWKLVCEVCAAEIESDALARHAVGDIPVFIV